MQIERVSDSVIKALTFAEGEAMRSGSAEIEPVHLLLGILSAKADRACELLNRTGVNLKDTRYAAGYTFRSVQATDQPAPKPILSAESESAMLRAIDYARESGMVIANTTCVLKSLLDCATVSTLVEELGVSVPIFRDSVETEILASKNIGSNYKRGDVLLISFSSENATEPKNAKNKVTSIPGKSPNRPAIVISNPSADSADIIVVPLTTDAQGPHSIGPIETGSVEARRMGLRVTSYICCDVISTIPRQMISSQLGTAPDDVMLKIAHQLRELLVLGSPPGRDDEAILRKMSRMAPEAAEEMLLRLSPRERDVVSLRIGLKDGRRKTTADIAQLFGVTQERVRMILARAMRKLNM